MTLATWPRALRVATFVIAGLGLAATLGYYAAVSIPSVRAQAAAHKWYPSNFAGWDELADAVRGALDEMPPGTRIVADNFKVGAELGFALGQPDIAVLDHPINHKHGRAPQLRLWGLESPGRDAWGNAPVLLVVGASEVEYKNLLQRYHVLCSYAGPLPAPRVINIDHGRQRFLLFRLEERSAAQACTTPSMAWIDTPVAGARLGHAFNVAGWAFKDGVGLARVEVLLDGKPVAGTRYGLPRAGVKEYWPQSTDPGHPNMGFRGRVELPRSVEAGRHWLGLRLHGRDGSIETWPEQPIQIEEAGVPAE